MAAIADLVSETLAIEDEQIDHPTPPPFYHLSADHVIRPGIVHRLDKGTTGDLQTM